MAMVCRTDCLSFFFLVAALSVVIGGHSWVALLTSILPSEKLAIQLPLTQRTVPFLLDVAAEHVPGMIFLLWWMAFAISSSASISSKTLRGMYIPGGSTWPVANIIFCALNWIVGHTFFWTLVLITLSGPKTSMEVQSMAGQFFETPLKGAAAEFVWLCLACLWYLVTAFGMQLVWAGHHDGCQRFAVPVHFAIAMLLLNFTIGHSWKVSAALSLSTLVLMEIFALARGSSALDIRLLIGIVLFVGTLPWLGIIVGLSMLWDFLDRLGRNKPTSGFIFRASHWLTRVTEKRWAQFLKHPADAYMVNVLTYCGVIVPALFVYSAWRTRVYGFSWAPWITFNILRVGPYMQTFGYMYALCHKEGHAHTGMWKEPYNRVLRYSFNWWAGLFYGVLPSTFTYGHTRNHHKYNNMPGDIVFMADRPRDSFPNFLAYVPRFYLYALNISSTIQFMREGLWKIAAKLAGGTAWYMVWCLFWCRYVGPAFMLGFVTYPLLENCLLLTVVNWSWHAMMSPDDPYDDYAGSLTILGGFNNVLEEDYHVVHHTYPSAHWTQHPELFKKHEEDYKKSPASAFQGLNVFEFFGLVVAQEYDQLTEHFVDLSGKLSKAEIRELIIARLRFCCCGPHASPEAIAAVAAHNKAE